MFIAVVMTEQSRRDPVEPGLGVRLGVVVPGSTLERLEENLRGEVICELTANPSRHVGVDGVEMPVEEFGEQHGVRQRACDETRVALRGRHHLRLPVTSERFTTPYQHAPGGDGGTRTRDFLLAKARPTQGCVLRSFRLSWSGVETQGHQGCWKDPMER